MRCCCCFKLLRSKSISGICGKCKFDPSLTISTTNAKKKYKLTDDEIEDAWLYSFEVSINGHGGYKYLIYDIAELAKNIFAAIDDNDKRKQAYLKNTKDDDDHSESVNNMRENIQCYFEDNDIQPDDHMLAFVEKIIKVKYEAEVDEVIGYIKRKVRIDNLLDEHDNSAFAYKFRDHKEYEGYIYEKSNGTAVKTYEKIENIIERKIVLDARKSEIEKFVEKKINKKYHNYVKTLSIYKKYRSNSKYHGTFDDVKKNIIAQVDKKKNFDSRYANLNEYLRTNYDVYTCKFLMELPVCDRYKSDIKYEIELDDIIKILDRHDKRKKSVDKFIEKNIDDDLIHFSEKLPIYKQYTKNIDNNTKLETVKEKILECIQKKLQLDKYIEKYVDEKYKEYVNNSPIYFDYISTDSDFKSVKKLIADSNKRHKEIYDKCGEWLRKADDNSSAERVLLAYEYGGGDVDDAICKIKDIILGFNNDKTRNIKHAIDDGKLTNVDPELYDDIKFNYLVGIIPLRDAREMLRDIMKNIDK
uniref:Uncharacterized protein n=1 Tax=viral metagenome TaxID=1070528 RepID=A0A6C0C7L3_9ZZZZ